MAKLLALSFTVIALLLVLGITAYATSWYRNSLPESERPVRVSCTGTIAVPLALGDPTLDGVECVRDPCGLFSGAGLSVLRTEGQLHLVVDGVVRASEGYSSWFGRNQEFSIRSACVVQPDNIKLRVYDRDGELADTAEVTLQ